MSVLSDRIPLTGVSSELPAPKVGGNRENHRKSRKTIENQGKLVGLSQKLRSTFPSIPVTPVAQRDRGKTPRLDLKFELLLGFDQQWSKKMKF